MKFKTEEELEMATKPIVDEYFDYWSWQVPNHERVIDFGGIKDNFFIGIEYKLSNWKIAIWQAHAHRLIFDYLYILMPMRKISEALRVEAKKVGIGVLLFDGKEINIAIKPKKQRLIWILKRRISEKWIKEMPLHNRRLTEVELQGRKNLVASKEKHFRRL